MQNSKIDTLPRYRERLTPSLPFFVAIALLAPMVSLSFVPVNSTLALILGILVTALVMALVVAMSPMIELSGTELRVGRARIDVKWLGELQVLREDAARHARGPGLSPRSWHQIRGGIAEILVAEVVDPADPVTSWVISTRTPDRLAAAINRARG
jgi:hypothetical protein